MLKKRHKVIIDTNLWISFLLTNNLSQLDELINKKKIILLFSKELLDEFVAVAQRPKFKKYFTVDDLEHLLDQIHLHAEFIICKSEVLVCRDKEDNFLLSLAKDGKATHLITGDKDLLVLEEFGKTKIVTIADYLLQP